MNCWARSYHGGLAVSQEEREQVIDKGIKALDKALEIDPDDPNALFDLAILHMDWKKEPEKAKEDLAKFLKAAPSSHPKRADAEARYKELQSGKGGSS